jgi:beta-lactamase regulating signal transducer with metallopeptidase domain
MSLILLALAIRSAVMVLVAGGVAFLLRKRSAAWRYAVWQLTFIGLLLMPALFFRLPTWSAPIERSPVVQRIMRVADTLQGTPPSGVFAPSPQFDSLPVKRPQTPIDWSVWIVGIWAALSFFAAVPLVRALADLRLVIRYGRRLEMPQFRELCARLRVQQDAELRVSSQVFGPATAGFLKPMVFLPYDTETWSGERLEIAFRHELAHIRRGDWLMRLLAHGACIVYAPNPLVWMASARLRAESEAACDDWVIAGGIDPKAYAKELLAIAQSVRHSSLAVATVGMAYRSKVEERLRAIVDPSRRRGTVGAWVLSFTAAGACLTLALVVSFRIGSAQVGSSSSVITSLAIGPGPAYVAHPFVPIRDDVSDHPNVPPVLPGAKVTTFRVPVAEKSVTVARNGVARLPNGVTVTLKGISEDPLDVGMIGRDLRFLIVSQTASRASTMGYVASPSSPDVYRISPGTVVLWRMGHMENDTPTVPGSVRTMFLGVPKGLKIDTVTYRVGVATGEWKSVMDVRNPFHSFPGGGDPKDLAAGGRVCVNAEPCIQGPADPANKMSHHVESIDCGGAASDLVPRRALILDSKGDLIRGDRSMGEGTYLLTGEELRRCTHVVIQEREMQWAEFRNLRLRSKTRL